MSYYAEKVFNSTTPKLCAFVFEANANGDSVIAECYRTETAERIAAALNEASAKENPMIDEQLKADVELISGVIEGLKLAGPKSRYAWQRIRARLEAVPDREEVAWRLFKLHMCSRETIAARVIFEESKPAWLRNADAAIAAITGEAK